MTTLEQRSRSSSGCSSSSYSHRHCPVALSFNRTAGRRISCAAQQGPVSARATLLAKGRCVFHECGSTTCWACTASGNSRTGNSARCHVRPKYLPLGYASAHRHSGMADSKRHRDILMITRYKSLVLGRPSDKWCCTNGSIGTSGASRGSGAPSGGRSKQTW